MNGLHVRWMICRDMPEILEIEKLCFSFPWPEDEFIRVLRQRNCIGMVAECDDKVLGYMVYELNKTCLRLLNFAVLPSKQRQGVGLAMAAKMAGKLTPMRCSHIVMEVRETNLDALLFWKAMGYLAVSVLRDHYEDSDEDAIVMQYRCPAPVEACVGK